MSTGSSTKRRTALEIRGRKGGQPIVSLTAYSAVMARLVEPHVDVLLVGDSLAMVEYGMDSTLAATPDMMIRHGAAVVSATSRPLVVIDLPFGSYEAGPQEAFATASAVMAGTGAGAVKLEGGRAMAPTIRFLSERGIPVMAHVGLTPQAVNVLGGFRSQGHDEAARAAILKDAEAVAEAGVVEPLADEITARIGVPTIGIGASASCDGQILVLEDMLGLTPRVPRFVHTFGALAGAVDEAVSAYASAVKERRFPGPDNVYKPRG